MEKIFLSTPFFLVTTVHMVGIFKVLDRTCRLLSKSLFSY